MQELLALFQAVPLGIAVIDRDLRFVQLNERLAQMNATSVEFALGRTIDEVLPHAAHIIRPPILRVLQTGETLQKLPLTGALPPQTGPGWMHVETDYHPLRDTNGAVVRVLVMVRDITQEVETREAIERERARASGAVRAVGGLAFEWDPLTDTVEWSEGIERLTGYEASEIAPGSAGWRAHVLPEDVWKISEATRHYLATGENKPLPYRFRRKDGTIAWFSTTVERVRDARGRECVFGLVRDVTQQMQASEELRASEERFRTLADLVPDIIWTASAEGRTDWLNRRWTDYTGAPIPTTAEGWRAPMHAEDFQRVFVAWAQAVERGESYEAEYRLRRHDGVYHWFLGRAIPLRDESGAVVKWLGTATDVHEYRLTLDRLQAAEEQKALALEAGRIGAFQWRGDANHLIFSPEAQRLLGLESTEYAGAGQGWRSAVHPDDREMVKTLTEQAVLARQSRLQMEFRVLVENAGPRWIESRGRIEYDENGAPIRTSGVFVDITARKQQEERINLLLREMHHRLKNAFAMIAALIGLSAKTATDVKSYSESLRGRVQSLALAHTLSFADTENETVGVIELTRQLLAPFTLDEDTRVSVSGSPRLRVVERHVSPLALTLHELATNAVKYGALRTLEGRLSILVEPTAEIGGAGIAIRWREKGGLPPEDTPRGFGSVLIERSMQQIGAQLDRRYENGELRVDLILPQ
jgi:PAS domain S-box-containing protein